MQPGATTCTEDRIQHALERCLHGLTLGHRSTSWPGVFFILLGAVLCFLGMH